MRVLGFMSGTSLDAVDLAIVETDGTNITGLGPTGGRDLPDVLRRRCLEATTAAQEWFSGPEPEMFALLADALANFQATAALDFLQEHGLSSGELDAAGFHGQTLVHRRPTDGGPGRTIQIGSPHLVARALGVPVVYDLRQADMAAGGQGAPLAPVYHAALVRYSGFQGSTAVLNLGGVSNLTFIGEDGVLTAFDAGPANGPLDQWIEQHGQGRYDEDGRISGTGDADEVRIRSWLSKPFFQSFGPKSLDRFEFTPELVASMTLADGAATLAAFSAACVAHALGQAPQSPTSLIVCGGGRRNVTVMSELRRRLPCAVLSAEDVGWRGDAIEAEAWAFLAARSLAKLPITFPGTTGVAEPLTGGRVALAA